MRSNDHPFADFGRALRNLRQRRGISQADHAEHAGLHRSSISAYERGAKLPGLATLGWLLVGLGADLCDLQTALQEVGDRAPLSRSRLCL